MVNFRGCKTWPELANELNKDDRVVADYDHGNLSISLLGEGAIWFCSKGWAVAKETNEEAFGAHGKLLSSKSTRFVNHKYFNDDDLETALEYALEL